MRLLLLCFYALAALPAISQSYFIQFPDDVLDMHCILGEDYSQPIIYNPDSLPIVMEQMDAHYGPIPESCYKFERTWRIYNAATYNPDQGCIYIPNPNPSAILNHPTNLPGPIVSSIATTGDPWSATMTKIVPADLSPTNYSVYWSANPNCYVYKQIIKVWDTQNPVVSDCLAAPSAILDTSLNDPSLWNAPYWWDEAASNQDMRESALDLSLAVYDSCSGTSVGASFVLVLDLDQNGTQETAIYSNNPPPPGAVFFDNINNNGTLRYFDQRPGVDSVRRYRFAIEWVSNSNPKIFRLRWKEGQYPDTMVWSLPQLPPGLHRIKWIAEDGCGNSTVCDYNFEMLGGVVSVFTSPGLVSRSNNLPNPFREQTNIPFDLQEASQVRLQVWNAAGQKVHETTAFFSTGAQVLTIQKTDLGNISGLYWYSLEAGQSSVVGKMALLP